VECPQEVRHLLGAFFMSGKLKYDYDKVDPQGLLAESRDRKSECPESRKKHSPEKKSF
jgi:hypothetical protein